MENLEIKINLAKSKQELQKLLEMDKFKEKSTLDTVKEIITNLLDLKVIAEDINASKISLTLKSLLSKGEEELNKIVKKLIIKWKGIVQVSKKAGVSGCVSDKKKMHNKSSHIINPLQMNENVNEETLDLKEEPILKKESAKMANIFRFTIEKEEKDLRRRNTKLLVFDSLMKAKDDPEFVFEITKEIEDGLYTHFMLDKNTMTKGINYKAKYLKQAKNIVMNIQNNNEFVQDILTGKLSGNQLAQMNPLDFASESNKQKRQKLLEDAFNSRRSDWNRLKNSAAVGLYKCGKCKTYKTTYYQAQIRRADEPMTTFVSCLECTHSWKF